VVGVGQVVKPVAGNQLAARVAIAEDRRVDVAERPDILPVRLQPLLFVGQASFDDLLAVVVIVLGRAADDPLGPTVLAVVLIRDGRGAVAGGRASPSPCVRRGALPRIEGRQRSG